MSKSLPIKPRKILKNRLVHETFHGAAEGLNRSHRGCMEEGDDFEQTSRASLRTTVQRICLARAANFNLSVFLKRHQKLQGADSSNSEPDESITSEWYIIRMCNGCTRNGIADRWKITPHKTNISTEKNMVIEPLKWSLFRGHLNFLGEGLLRSIRRGVPENLRSPGFTKDVGPIIMGHSRRPATRGNSSIRIQFANFLLIMCQFQNT